MPSKSRIVLCLTFSAMSLLQFSCNSADVAQVPSQSVPAIAVEPPQITKVVLYKHGLGYIEREGLVNDNVSFSLYFPERVMNDILASFYILDLSGGKITSIQYETQEPLSERLKKILIKIPDSNTMSGLVSELKGAEVFAKSANENLNGRILGLESVVEIVQNQSVTKDYKLVIMTDSGAVRSMNISSLIELDIKNESLKKDINELLNISLDSKYANLKKMTITAQGKGERKLRVGYLINMPVWKCSYRLIFDSKNKEKALIQGWALAENTTDDDWKDISISFVTGNPISFSMNLYSPLYISRQNVPLPGIQNLNIDWGNAPKQQSAAETMKRSLAAAPVPAMAKAGGRGELAYDSAAADNMVFAAAVPEQEESMSDYIASSVSQSAAGKALDTLFSYNVSEMVSILQKRAAMVPILTSELGCRKILYYKQSFSSNVLNAAALLNNTALTLDAGPVSFFENNASLGEGIINQVLTSGNQAIIPYAVASYASVTTSSNYEKSSYFRGKLVNGILTLTSTEFLTQKMTIESKGKTDETLWIERPETQSYTLVEPEKPLSKTEGNYLFEIALKAGEKKEFTIKEKRDIDERLMISNIDEKTIAFYASAQYLDSKTRSLLKDVSGLKAKISELQRSVQSCRNQISALSEKQNRIRQNLALLKDSGNSKEQTLRANWIDALSSSESEIDALNKKINEANAAIQKLNNEIAQKINSFDK